LSSVLPGMQWSWDGWGGYSEATKSAYVYPGGNPPTVVTFPLTNLTSPAGGTVQATGSLVQLPAANCDPRVPLQGGSVTANLTVQ